MVWAAIYLCLFIVLLLWNGCFGLFNDRNISRPVLVALVFLKALAIPAFYFVYEGQYGGLARFDSGKFHADAIILNNCARQHPGEYLDVLGGDEDHICLDHTQNWKRGRSAKFFFNDNRLVIVWHSLVHFLPFASWPVHALLDCLLSFLGLFFVYKTFRVYLQGKEKLVLAVLCLLPSLWFHTGALLKEGMVTLLMGCICISIKRVVTVRNLRNFSFAAFFVFCGCFLKPYLILPLALTVFLLFYLQSREKFSSKAGLFVIVFAACIIAGNLLAAVLVGKNLPQLLAAQEKAFSGTAAGGIFLSGDTTFVRLPYDTSLIKRTASSQELYTIKKGARYVYWQDSHNQDTLFCPYNLDTVTAYELAFMTPRSRSNYVLPPITTKPLVSMATALLHTTTIPLFFNSSTAAELMTSMENLLILVSLLLIIGGLISGKRERLPPVALLSYAILIFLVVGLTSPNTGAVVRYRAPALQYLVLGALYYLPLRQKSRGGSTDGVR